MSSIDTSATSSLASSLQMDGSVASAVGVSMLKKSLELEAQSVGQLLQTMPDVQKSNPPHLGNSIDTYA